MTTPAIDAFQPGAPGPAPEPAPETAPPLTAADVVTAMRQVLETAQPAPVQSDPAPTPDDARLAALEQLVADLAAEVVPVVVNSSGTLKDRLTSRKLWIAAAAVLGILIPWLHGNISGVYAGPIIGAVTSIYLIVQAYVDATATKSVSTTTSVIVHKGRQT